MQYNKSSINILANSKQFSLQSEDSVILSVYVCYIYKVKKILVILLKIATWSKSDIDAQKGDQAKDMK